MSDLLENKISYKMELYIVLATAVFPILVGIVLFYAWFNIPDDEWYKIPHLLFTLIIFTYPILHYRDRRNQKKLENSKEADKN